MPGRWALALVAGLPLWGGAAAQDLSPSEAAALRSRVDALAAELQTQADARIAEAVPGGIPLRYLTHDLQAAIRQASPSDDYPEGFPAHTYWCVTRPHHSDLVALVRGLAPMDLASVPELPGLVEQLTAALPSAPEEANAQGRTREKRTETVELLRTAALAGLQPGAGSPGGVRDLPGSTAALAGLFILAGNGCWINHADFEAFPELDALQKSLMPFVTEERDPAVCLAHAQALGNRLRAAAGLEDVATCLQRLQTRLQEASRLLPASAGAAAPGNAPAKPRTFAREDFAPLVPALARPEHVDLTPLWQPLNALLWQLHAAAQPRMALGFEGPACITGLSAEMGQVLTDLQQPSPPAERIQQVARFVALVAAVEMAAAEIHSSVRTEPFGRSSLDDLESALFFGRWDDEHLGLLPAVNAFAQELAQEAERRMSPDEPALARRVRAQAALEDLERQAAADPAQTFHLQNLGAVVALLGGAPAPDWLGTPTTPTDDGQLLWALAREQFGRAAQKGGGSAPGPALGDQLVRYYLAVPQVEEATRRLGHGTQAVRTVLRDPKLALTLLVTTVVTTYSRRATTPEAQALFDGVFESSLALAGDPLALADELDLRYLLASGFYGDTPGGYWARPALADRYRLALQVRRRLTPQSLAVVHDLHMIGGELCAHGEVEAGLASLAEALVLLDDVQEAPSPLLADAILLSLRLPPPQQIRLTPAAYPDLMRADIHCLMAGAHRLLGNADRALALYAEADRLARKTLAYAAPDRLADILEGKSLTYLEAGDAEASLASLQEALQLRERCAHGKTGETAEALALANTLGLLGEVYLLRGDLDQASQRFEQGREALRLEGQWAQAAMAESAYQQSDTRRLDLGLGRIALAREDDSAAHTHFVRVVVEAGKGFHRSLAAEVASWNPSFEPPLEGREGRPEALGLTAEESVPDRVLALSYLAQIA